MFFVLMREFKTFDGRYWMCCVVTHLSLMAYLRRNDRPLRWTTLMVFMDSSTIITILECYEWIDALGKSTSISAMEA